MKSRLVTNLQTLAVILAIVGAYALTNYWDGKSESEASRSRTQASH